MSTDSSETRETNSTVSQFVATSIDKLVDQKIITPSQASQSPSIKIDEYILRYLMKQNPSDYMAARSDKLQTHFGVPLTDAERAKRLGEIEDCKATLRQVVEMTQHTLEGRGLEGVILFGSRMDPVKSPRSTSDVDFILVLSPETHKAIKASKGKTSWTLTPLYQTFKDILEKKPGFAESANLVSIITSDELRQMADVEHILDLETAGAQLWMLDPQVPYYVGKHELDFNHILHKHLTSKTRQEWREQVMSQAKESLVTKSL